MQTPQNILYFINGSIGDLLMVLALLEEVHAQDASVRLYIATPRNVALYREFVAAYPYVTILDAGRRSAIHTLWPFLGRKNICITPPTPGRIPLATKLVARLLGLRGILVGFEDGSPLNRFLYTQTVPHNTTKLYCDLLADLLVPMGLAHRRFVPVFHADPVSGVLARFGLMSHGYVVLHPMGSSRTRSIVGEELRRLIREIKTAAPQLTVALSGSVADGAAFGLTEDDDAILATGLAPREIAALIQESALYIGVDTGITHLACTLGARSLILAHNGTPHWLPYYNAHATVVYKVRDDSAEVYEGRAHLEACRAGRTHYLDRIPESVVFMYVRNTLAALGKRS